MDTDLDLMPVDTFLQNLHQQVQCYSNCASNSRRWGCGKSKATMDHRQTKCLVFFYPAPNLRDTSDLLYVYVMLHSKISFFAFAMQLTIEPKMP